jgi:flagellar motor switch protein FliG
MPMATTSGTMTQKEKAAILIITLGREHAAKLYRYLSEEEVEQLTLAITGVNRVSHETKEKVLGEFFEVCMAQRFISEGGIEYARDILDKAFGESRANELIERLSSSLQVRPFDFIRRMEGAQILNFIQNEHPQTIALILSYLDPKQSAFVISSLPIDKQTSVLARIANMGSCAPEYISEVERVLEQKLSSLSLHHQTIVGGVSSLVNILNSVDRGTEKRLLESLEETDPELAEEVRNQMFVFEDIVRLNSQAVQRVLREVDNHDLALALKSANQEVAKVIYANISKRLQEMIKEDLDFMGPVRVRDVEEAQQRIVNTIRKLDDAGEIIIARQQEDEVIV